MHQAMMPQSSTRKLISNVFIVALWLAVGDCQGTTSVGPICKNIDFIHDGDVIATEQSPFKVGSSLVFICDDGFKAHGKPVITCMSTGRWSGPVPYCHTTTCQRNITKITDGRKCRKSCARESDCKGQYKKCRCDDWCGMSCFNPDADCVALIDLENGYIIGDERSYGRTVTYYCNEGFVLVGESTRQCQSNRNWSGSAPKCFAFSACGKLQNRSPSLGNVVDGTDAKLGDWPWQALLFDNSDHDVGQLYDIASGFGGGSIIDNKWILTAAHVIDEFPIAVKAKSGWKKEFLIALGIISYPKVGQHIPDHVHIFEPSDVHVYRHPKFDGATYDYDVGLIRIGNRLKRVGDKFVIDSSAPEGLITFTRYIRPVCLPCIKNYPTDMTTEWWNGFEKDKCAQESAKLIKEGETVWVTGFGYTKFTGNSKEGQKFKPDTLKEGQLEIWGQARCAKGLQEIRSHYAKSRYTGRMFCAGSGLQSKNVDSCGGDSGGAVVKQIPDGEYWIELGIVSWGWECGTRLPGFYVRLPSVMSWVVQQVSEKLPDCTGTDSDWCARLVAMCHTDAIKEMCANTCGQCNSQNDDEEVLWLQWSIWGDCDATCGGGFRVRTRQCITNNCQGEASEKILCDDDPCSPILGPFGKWKECSATCGNGIQDRTRPCLEGDCNPAELTESRICKSRDCEEWTEWQEWARCSVSCGGGFRTRSRECVHGEPGNVGCFGPKEDIQRCRQQRCPEWTSWTSSVTNCPVTCGGGVIKRFRSCLYGQTEDACRNLGPSEDIVPCETNPCEVWTNWQVWASCSVSCGGGSRIRHRLCRDGIPGDLGCTGPEKELKSCGQQRCPEWMSWTSSKTRCPVTCGGGVIKRFRRCQPEGACSNLGPSEDAVPCATNPCEGIMLFDTISKRLQLFNSANNTLKQMQNLNFDIKRTSYTAVTLDDFIYGLLHYKLVYRLKYADERATWERMPDVIYDHGDYPPSTVMSGCIYVGGGGSYGTETNAVEKFDPLLNKWSSLKNKTLRTNNNALVVAQGFLYSIGGRLKNESYLKEVERFDPVSSTWAFVAPMKQARWVPAAVELNGKIFVLGGWNDGELSSVEIYDISTNTWSAMKERMLRTRHTFVAFVINSDIYAVGGYNTYNSIERYSSERNVWEEVQIQTEREIYIHTSTMIQI